MWWSHMNISPGCMSFSPHSTLCFATSVQTLYTSVATSCHCPWWTRGSLKSMVTCSQSMVVSATTFSSPVTLLLQTVMGISELLVREVEGVALVAQHALRRDH